MTHANMENNKNSIRIPKQLTFTEPSHLSTFLDANSNVTFLDLHKQQWLEWKMLRYPTKNKSKVDFLAEYYSLSEFAGNFFYYPWRNQLVRIIDQPKFLDVVTNRNKHKITAEEQEVLLTKKIGVVGLSVGRTVSTTIAMEKICGELRVADFDELDLSNLNRIKAPIFDLGELKTTSLSREISEIDPYFELTCYSEGLTANNINDFFSSGSQLDLVIDECDDLGMKVLIRKKAKEMGIPVLMDTSDRGMLDIERYDLDPNLHYFHGRIGDFDPPYTWRPLPEERMGLFSKILDISQLSKRGQHSLTEIGKSISTWPQLASAVVAGGGNCTEVARRILLGEKVPSGRFFMDTETLIANES